MIHPIRWMRADGRNGNCVSTRKKNNDVIINNKINVIISTHVDINLVAKSMTLPDIAINQVSIEY